MNTRSPSLLEPAGASVSADSLIAGRYRVLERVGRGGNAEVFVVRDVDEDRVVALKLVAEPDAAARQRLTAEFEALSSLQHRNIVVPYRMFIEGQRLAYTMELVEGEPLVELAPRLRADMAFLRATLQQLTGALEAIHAHGLVHGDIAPDNVLVAKEGRLVLLDLGEPRRRAADRQWSGTPPYMAPELFTGSPPSAATDWYAVGALIHECIAGRVAFPQEELAALCDAKQRGAIAALDVESDHTELARVIVELMHPQPEQRADSRALRDVLRLPRWESPSTQPALGPLIGRRRELATLHDRLELATRGRRLHVVALGGAPGVGKSRLLDSFRTQVQSRGLAFALGWRCTSASTVPLRIIGGLLDDLVARAHDELPFSIERCYPRHAAELRATFPATAGLFGRGRDPAATRAGDDQVALDLAGRAAADLFGRVSEHVPLLLCLDDMQVSDPDAAETVLRLLIALGECPVLCVLAHGDDERPRAAFPAFLEACRRHVGQSQITQLRLGELPREQLVAIAWEQLTSWQGSASIVERIGESARGNPGMCVWYARALQAAPAAETMKAGADAMEESVFERIWARLSDDARELCRGLALAGEALPRGVLGPLLRGDDRADAALRDLEHFGFLRRSDSSHVVPLWHERIAEHALARMGTAEIAARHLALGEALAAADPQLLGRAAHHLAAAGQTERAVQSYALAVDRAQAEGAHHRAAELIRAALALNACAGAERQRLEIQLAESLARLGRLREAAELAIRLCAAPGLEPSVAARLRQRSIGALGALAETQRVKSLFEDAAGVRPGSTARAALARLVALRLRIAARPPWKSTRVRSPDPRAEHELDLLWIAGSRLLHLEPMFAAYLISRHMLLAFRSVSIRHEARALAFEAVMLTSGGDKKLTQASTLLAAAERRAQACDDDGARAAIHQGAGFMWGNVARYREAIEEGRRCIEVLEHAADVPTYEITHARMELGWRLSLVGEYREVLSLAAGALRDALECEDPVLASAFHVQLANSHLAADRPSESLHHLQAAERWCPASFEVGQVGICMGRIAHHLYAGEIEAALAYLDANRRRVEALRILGLPAVRTMYRYRVGVLLSRARLHDNGAVRLRRDFDRIRAKIRGESFEVAVAHARLLDASHHAFRGERDLAMGHLREGADRFAALGWEGLATLARDEYRTLQSAARPTASAEILARIGIAEPERWSLIAVPAIDMRDGH